MPRKKKCSFCGEGFEAGTGSMFVKNDGSIFDFCSSKCRKNYDLGRNPIRVRWTKKFRTFREETLGIRAKKAGETPKAKPEPKPEEAPKAKPEPKPEKKGIGHLVETAAAAVKAKAATVKAKAKPEAKKPEKPAAKRPEAPKPEKPAAKRPETKKPAAKKRPAAKGGKK